MINFLGFLLSVWVLIMLVINLWIIVWILFVYKLDDRILNILGDVVMLNVFDLELLLRIVFFLVVIIIIFLLIYIMFNNFSNF